MNELGALQSGAIHSAFPRQPTQIAKNPACGTSGLSPHLTVPFLPKQHSLARLQSVFLPELAHVCADTISCPAIMARVYADVNQNMPRAYWDYDSVNISELSGSVLPNPSYASATACFGRTNRLTISMFRLGCPRKLRGRAQDRFVLSIAPPRSRRHVTDRPTIQAGANIPRSSRVSTWLTTRSASSRS